MGQLKLATMAAALFISCVTVVVPKIKISELLAHPDRYDGKGVAVAGTVEHIQLKKSIANGDYELFQLCNKRCIRVFAREHPRLRNGVPELIRGTFVLQRHTEAGLVSNELEADGDQFLTAQPTAAIP